jgi:pimeloyl-ACP methyl ester carboxylesterase
MNPILLLHGALGAQTQLQHIACKLQDARRTVHSMDFSGHHGVPFSSRGFGIEVFADDILDFLDKNNIQIADIFGYSMGGYVAVWLAHIRPERIGRIITLGTKFDWNVATANREIAKMDARKIEEKVPAFARILESRHRPNDWKELMIKTAEMMQGLGSHPLLSEEILTTIQVPVEIYLGDLDDMADRDYSMRVASLLPAGTFSLLANTRHPIENVTFVPFLDTPDWPGR